MSKENFIKEYSLVEVSDISEMFGVCEATVINWIKTGKLKAYYIGRQYRICQCDVLNFLKSCVA